ncbi:MAG: hypothetical protein IPN01_36050 [Deltaproteobacteria bacterium]|nr:hypothetical protein [Deltaproteobacteria bacterium]
MSKRVTACIARQRVDRGSFSMAANTGEGSRNHLGRGDQRRVPALVQDHRTQQLLIIESDHQLAAQSGDEEGFLGRSDTVALLVEEPNPDQRLDEPYHAKRRRIRPNASRIPGDTSQLLDEQATEGRDRDAHYSRNACERRSPGKDSWASEVQGQRLGSLVLCTEQSHPSL